MKNFIIIMGLLSIAMVILIVWSACVVSSRQAKGEELEQDNKLRTEATNERVRVD